MPHFFFCVQTGSTSNSLKSGLSGCSSTSLPVSLPEASKASYAVASESHYERLGGGLPSGGGRVRDGGGIAESTTAAGATAAEAGATEDSASISHPNPPQFVPGEPAGRSVAGRGGRSGETEDGQVCFLPTLLHYGFFVDDVFLLFTSETID